MSPPTNKLEVKTNRTEIVTDITTRNYLILCLFFCCL